MSTKKAPAKNAKPKAAATKPAATTETPAEAPVAAQPAPSHVLVRVGPASSAGRIMLGQTVYDGLTPRRMARADYERLKDRYDLQVVEAD